MSLLRLSAFAALLLLSVLPVQVAAQPGGVQYDIYLDCGASAPVGQPGTPVTTGSGGCPIRATDSDDLMGDPSLAVDPLRPENLILASLHGCVKDATCPLSGGPCAGAPNQKARCGQVFTTFTSQSQGQSWIDNPFVPPDDIGADALGMHPQVTIDPYGQVYVGSLYAIPAGQTEAGDPAFDYVIAAQKFESIDTIDEEQASSNGGYNAEYITPVYEGNQIDQMWFLFNPVTDNMTLVWRESIPVPPVPPCDSDTSYLLDAGGFYVKANPVAQEANVYQESNGMAGLQTAQTCPGDPDSTFVLVPVLDAAAPVVPAAAPAATAAPPVDDAPRLSVPLAGLPAATVAALRGEAPPAAAPQASAAAPAMRLVPAPAAPAAAQQDDEEGNATVSAIGLVWTTSDSDTPYYYQDLEDTIQPCSGSTNPVLSYGWLYIGCIVDTSQGEFRWNPGVANGTVQLFRMDPDGGKPEYMGQAPDMVGPPKLGVRSDGRLALIAGGVSEQKTLLMSAAYGQYDPLTAQITWSKQLSVGRDVIETCMLDNACTLDPSSVEIVRADIQDMIYREQSGALHLILKTTIGYVDGADDALDRLALAPHIQKTIVAIDERYGVLDVLPLTIGAPLQRQSDATIAGAPENAFQDLSDDFLALPAEPFTYNGKDFGDLYQREFFAIGDYGTILFAELIEETNLTAPTFALPPSPPPPAPAAATTNLLVPVAGVAGTAAVMGTLVAHRRKNPLAAITKG